VSKIIYGYGNLSNECWNDNTGDNMTFLETKIRGIKTGTAVITLLLCTNVSGTENKSGEKHLNEETRSRPVINFQNSAPHKSKTYSCNLLQNFYQCREYGIIPTAKIILNDIQESCESMGGEFRQTHCPTLSQISVCSEVIRNLHKPDVIYNNIYYSGNQSHWDIETTQRVCDNLGGKWLHR
jgi:hypothetical protein